MALTKCTETASSSQPLLPAAGQGGREQSLNPAFHMFSPPLISLEWPVPSGVTQSRRARWWSCQRAVLAACARGAPRAAPPLVPALGPPQARCLLGRCSSAGVSFQPGHLLLGLWTPSRLPHLSH